MVYAMLHCYYLVRSVKLIPLINFCPIIMGRLLGFLHRGEMKYAFKMNLLGMKLLVLKFMGMILIVWPQYMGAETTGLLAELTKKLLEYLKLLYHF